jgi:acetylornithine/N-succinyldiaminopimelate aminotransferase
MMSLSEREHSTLFQTYKRLPIHISRAYGVTIVADDGVEYLDFLGGIAVNALGHSHPAVVEAVQHQAGQYMHVSNYFYQEPQIALAEALKNASGYDRVFLTNSGTEAAEGAIKLARRFGSADGRYDIVGFTGGFHGRTYGPLSVMDKPMYKDGMGPFLPNTLVLPFNDVDALEARVDAGTAAVMLEFLQGEGGLAEASGDFVDALERLRREHNFLLIADEVQAGIGRTGDFFSFQKYGIRPDIILVAKAVGGGLPLGAILATESVASLFGKGSHGTTYGGNAVACAAGLAVVNAVTGGLMDYVRHIGAYMGRQLAALQERHPLAVREIRGRGCMQGVVLASDSAPVVDRLLHEHRIITNATAGSVIRLVPPYIINEGDVDRLVAALDTIL